MSYTVYDPDFSPSLITVIKKKFERDIEFKFLMVADFLFCYLSMKRKVKLKALKIAYFFFFFSFI